jgi:uncharacterized repeat protein (TIGR01451 family)
MSRIAVVVLAVAFFAVAVVAQAQQQPATAPNPNLTPRCGLNVIVVLDASYSIQQSNGTEDVRNAAKTFIGAFAGTGTKIAMFDFALKARINVDVPYTEVTDGSLKAVFNPAAARYKPLTTSPDYYTNWDNALLQALHTSDAGTPRANAVVFVTDGDPTALNNNHGKPTEVTVPGAATSSSANTLNYAIEHANELKREGTHVFAFGVGNGVTSAASQTRLKAISGTQEFKPGVPIGSVDWVVVKNFGDLADTLADLATSLCASSVRVTKRVDEDGDGSYDDPAGGWTFAGALEMSSGSYDWRQPAGSTTSGQRRVTVTDDNPTAMFEWDPHNAAASATFTFSESARLGYRFVDADCGDRSVAHDDGDFTVKLPAGQSASCVVRNARLREVTFCHGTGDRDDPYDIRTAFLDAAGRALLSEHNTHDGPVFPAPGWGDIIPPYEGDPVGLNWNGVGQVVWQNKCVIPPAVRAITPTVRCVEALDNGDLRAHFGFTNPSAEALTLRSGSEWNAFSPDPADRGQLERFLPTTTVDDVVQVRFGAGERLIWTLGTHQVTASATTRRCLGTLTVVKRLNPAGDGRFNLRIDGKVAGTGLLVGDNGTTGTVEVAATPAGTSHTIDETAGPRTRLDRYDTSTVCRGDAGVIGENRDGAELTVTVREGEDVVCTITNTRRVERILPVLECVRFTPAGPDVAVWGYDNPNDFPVDLSVGQDARNVFLPAPANRGQMVTFAPGRQHNVLEVPFEGTLTWRLDTAVTAGAGSVPCPAVLPEPLPTPTPVPPAPPTLPTATDIAVTKIATPPVVAVGGRVTYTVTVTNTSAVSAADVTVFRADERLERTSTFVSVTPSQGSCDSIDCHFGALGAGASATLVVVTEETSTRLVANTIRASTSTPETDLANNTASAVVRVIGAVSPAATERCVAVVVAPSTVRAGRTAVVTARALDAHGRRVGGLALRLRGAGVDARRTTTAAGSARFAFTPRHGGVISLAPPGRTVRPGLPEQCGVVLGATASQRPSGVTG